MTDSSASADAQREAIADAFGRDLDPLAEIASEFDEMEADPFDLFVAFDLETRDIADGTIADYRRIFDEWKAHMVEQGRHPACPNESHVKAYIRQQLNKGNQANTIKGKLRKIATAYEFWQRDAAFPHPQDYDPIQSAIDATSFEQPESKEPPRIPVEELRDVMADVTRIRDRALIGAQLKLGLRCGELINIKLPEVSIENSELERHYPEMGTHSRLEGRPNAVFIPADREGNKSKRPRVLPLDDELRQALLRSLLIRPTVDEDWLFLSKQRHKQLGVKDVNRAWKAAFGDEYPETDQHAAVTSHFGRHRFTTFWRVEKGVNRELIKYMRGDVVGAGPDEEAGAIDTYLHTYYEDIEVLYRENIYKLGL